MKKLILTICFLVAATCAFGQGRVWPNALDDANDLFDIGGGTKFSNFLNDPANAWDNNTATDSEGVALGEEAVIGLHSMSKRYVLTSFTVTMDGDAANRNWTNWVFEASNDTTDGTNGTWDAIQSFSTPVLIWEDFRIYKWRADTYNQDFNSTNGYNSFRWRVTSPLGDGIQAPHLSEVQLFGYEYTEGPGGDPVDLIVDGKIVVIGGKRIMLPSGTTNNLIDNSDWWTPDELGTNVIGWWDASDISSLMLVGSETFQVNDKSVNSNNLVQSNPARAPGVWKRSIGDLNALECDAGLLGFMYVLNFQVPSDGDFAVFQVSHVDYILNTAASLYSMNATPNLDWQYAAGLVGAGYQPNWYGRLVMTGLGATSPLDYSATNRTTDSVHSSVFDFSGNSIRGYWDATVQASTTYGTKVNSDQNFKVMANRVPYTSTPNTVDGYTTEIVIVHDVSSNTIDKVHGYLHWKYGLEGRLPADNTYKNERPLK